MKILKIELENLNSLRGKWTINLSNEIYESNGIFAITGSTGAGKTTIFDAICLALYGQTPRLGKITENKNEIMSRRTKESYAKVEFEINGKKYLSEWEQHRAGKNNKLQKVRHVLSDIDEKKIITDSVTDTQAEIVKLTGLDFKRFRQAVMLEQGGFDAFLRANKKERAEILEVLTGTEIYSEISKRVHERKTTEENKLDNIKIQRDNIKPNDDFQSSEEILEAIEKLKNDLEAATNEQNENNSILEWLKGIQKLEKAISENAHEISQLEKNFEIFTAEARRLEAGQRAQELAGDFSKLNAVRENNRRFQINAEKLKNEISNLEAKILEIETQELPKTNQELQNMKKNFSLDESPESFCSMAKERVKIFADLAAKRKSIEDSKKIFERNFNQAQNILMIDKQNQKIFQEKYNAAEKKYYETSNMRLEAIFAVERRKLQHGKPCPLCGAAEHPYELKIRNEKLEIESFDDGLKFAKFQSDKARKELDAANEKLNLSNANESKARANLDNLIHEFNKISDQCAESKLEISDLIGKLGISVKLVREIIPAIDAWLKEINRLEGKLKVSNENLNFYKAKLETEQNSLENANLELKNSQEELNILEKNFEAKLHEKNFENEEIFIASIIEADEIKKLTARKQELENNKSKLQGIKDNFEKNLAVEKAKALTTKKLDEVENEAETRKKLISEFNKKIAMLEKDFDNRKKLKKELARLDKNYKEQEEIFSRWAALDKLIGSADGNNFRVFAQGLTLGTMINLANEQLEKMNGRYILIARPKSSDLELSVIDKEQAGEIRPTENLSGGERFIISLALALGLSQMSGNKTRIDSLFLDEGFGSLDEEALSQALEALGELHKNGRTIGIISHVSALRERIAAQIEVIYKSEGTSIIKGPGVFQLKSI